MSKKQSAINSQTKSLKIKGIKKDSELKKQDNHPIKLTFFGKLKLYFEKLFKKLTGKNKQEEKKVKENINKNKNQKQNQKQIQKQNQKPIKDIKQEKENNVVNIEQKQKQEQKQEQKHEEQRQEPKINCKVRRKNRNIEKINNTQNTQNTQNMQNINEEKHIQENKEKQIQQIQEVQEVGIQEKQEIDDGIEIITAKMINDKNKEIPKQNELNTRIKQIIQIDEAKKENNIEDMVNSKIKNNSEKEISQEQLISLNTLDINQIQIEENEQKIGKIEEQVQEKEKEKFNENENEIIEQIKKEIPNYSNIHLNSNIELNGGIYRFISSNYQPKQFYNKITKDGKVFVNVNKLMLINEDYSIKSIDDPTISINKLMEKYPNSKIVLHSEIDKEKTNKANILIAPQLNGKYELGWSYLDEINDHIINIT